MKEDFPNHYKEERIPDFKKETRFLLTNPNNPKELLRFEDFVNILYYDHENSVTIESVRNDMVTQVRIIKEAGFIEIYEDESLLYSFPDQLVVNRQAYLCHKMIEEDRYELVDYMTLKNDDTIIEEERKPAR